MKNYLIVLALGALFFLQGCKNDFVPISYGHEACTHCRMTIMDKRFAAEILTGKGKAYKFDDLGCLLSYIQDQKFHDPAAKIFVADFVNPDGPFLDAAQATFVRSESLHSPMGGNMAAEATTASAEELNKELHGNLLTWGDLKTK
jgi:copper chaperone NosL